MPPSPNEAVALKRLVVCCDGTWLDSDNGIETEGFFGTPRVQVPSNVTRLCRAITPDTADGLVAQIVYYQAGVGTGNSWWDKIVGGGTGLGLSENIREAYSFLANNYSHGDEIILVGFSRGAFTARSIAGLIGSIGLLTKRGLVNFYEIFKDYENSQNPKYHPKFPDVPFKNKPNILDPRYAEELEKRDMTRLDVPIKVVAVWDTVGSLGIPRIGWLEKIGIAASNKEYAFYDTKLGNHIEHAFHALALDELRTPFSPAVWERPKGVTTNLKQCWFPGAHSNVGGGYDDSELANITLAWIMAQLKPFVDFDRGYLEDQHQLNQEYYKKMKDSPRSWARGFVYKSSTNYQVLAGKTPRTPGHYTQPDPQTGKRTERPLEDTNEHIHASARLRLGLRHLGTEDKGPYNPVALSDWRLVGGEGRNGHIARHGQKAVSWEYTGPEGGVDVLPEDELGEFEKDLLKFDRVAYEKVLGSVPDPIS
ncbi:MAG: hypothetical protein M1832_003700 [Thelocarpon impressellum]|nr:MAG: hypothetical protein M1832_003700 [Thelocarpon impressellum]